MTLLTPSCHLDNFGGGTALAGGEGLMSENSSLFGEDDPLEEVIQPPAKPIPPPSFGHLPQIQLGFVGFGGGQGGGHPQAKAFAPLQQTGSLTITYDYDPLYRLTEANYSNSSYYHYTYDKVGNRLTQDTLLGGLPSTTSYVYDDANRLTSVNGVTYTWDANGNLLNDGVNAYAYDSANRLRSVSNQSTVSSYQYNGLGDRLSQTVNGNTTNYTLDLNAGLTQVLNDGTNTYLYGNGRIAQVSTTTEYFLGDALGSVRQLTNQSGQVTYARAYDPYGTATSTSGPSSTAYGYTGEFTSNELVYLRARLYAPYLNQFAQPDSISPAETTVWKRKSHLAVTFLCPHGDSNSISPAETTVWRKERTTFFKMALCAPMGIRTPVWALRGPRPGPLDDGGVLHLFPFLESVRDCIIPILNRQRERHARHRVLARRWYVTFRCRRCATDR